jgi:hypothetical protein
MEAKDDVQKMDVIKKQKEKLVNVFHMEAANVVRKKIV